MSAFLQHPLAWDDLKILLALMRRPTLKGAAEELGSVGSTVSRRLAALETSLGVRLFDRTPDGVLPTAAAEQLVGYAEQVEHGVAALLSSVEGLESKVEGVVRVTAPPGVADAFIAPRLPELLARHPGLRVELDGSVGYVDLTRREADLALRGMRPTTGDLVSVRIAREPDVLFASPAKVKEWGALRRLDRLPFIAYGASLAHIPTARWISSVTTEGQIVLRTNSAAAQLSACEAGVGALLFPRAFERVAKISPVKLSPALAKSLPPTPVNELHLVGHRALRSVPRISAVWAFLLEVFGVAEVAPH